ncbi:PAS domain-containing sensor histidine kinase [Afifella sp. IM 167]|uniref:sensor histidine kinase n=1 Tax=Afifella sp. IM 167 TaxID=2033586 RepID=UPI001CCAE241|nr:PAS domain-containing sensor histidine kinase [Afifella sp. IM 167]MBZ8133614.1 two-component sensor histidine kinase [Afifella sp. IM 167]
MDRQAGHRAIQAAGRIASGVAASIAVAPPASAASIPALLSSGGLSQLLWLAVTAGCAGTAVIAIGFLARRERDSSLADAQKRIAALQHSLDRSEALLASDDQKTICFSMAETEPVLYGALPERTGAPAASDDFLTFSDWLDQRSADALAECITGLRETGESFRLSLRTFTDCFLEATGRTSGNRAIIRLRELTGERRSFAELKEQAGFVISEMTALRSLAERLPFPLWRRNMHGRLSWANPAYLAATGASDLASLNARGSELLDPSTRDAIRAAHREGLVFHETVAVRFGQTKRQMDVFDIKAEDGTVGLAIDVTELENARGELRRNIELNARLLDEVSSAIAVFGGEQHLEFSNAAFRTLFGLSDRFLVPGTEEGVILDQLRAERQLPEQANYRAWRREHLEAYVDPQPREEMWHLPDGRSLRLIATPNVQGGFTYIYENVTERLSLESRVNALSRIQGETLDHLSEAVGVFGSDGRLRLYNPVLTEMWRLSPDFLSKEPHISSLIGHWMVFYPDQETWKKIATAITRTDAGESLEGRMERRGGSVIEYATVPLPQGMTLLTFADVTEKAQAHRFLEERNRLLEEADQLKSDFIQHVSYELRTPLASIIGFSQILASETPGELNEQQREYMGHISQSSDALLALVNDILDLATVDAGIMELEIGEVDIAGVVRAAVEGIGDRVEEKKVALAISAPAGLGSFRADASRVRQILYNLLSNAINFSLEGGRVGLSAEREEGHVVFRVSDEGPGIPEAIRSDIFKPFEGTAPQGGRRGAGLGLSIVKRLVELHHGEILIDSEEGAGTTTTVRLPVDVEEAVQAAE